MVGCVICGLPVSPKDDIEDRCGHHRRQLLRNKAKAEGLPSPTKKRVTKPKPEPNVLEELSPAAMRVEHLAGFHKGVVRIACVSCVRERGGSIGHVEMMASTPEELRR